MVACSFDWHVLQGITEHLITTMHGWTLNCWLTYFKRRRVGHRAARAPSANRPDRFHQAQECMIIGMKHERGIIYRKYNLVFNRVGPREQRRQTLPVAQEGQRPDKRWARPIRKDLDQVLQTWARLDSSESIFECTAEAWRRRKKERGDSQIPYGLRERLLSVTENETAGMGVFRMMSGYRT